MRKEQFNKRRGEGKLRNFVKTVYKYNIPIGTLPR